MSDAAIPMPEGLNDTNDVSQKFQEVVNKLSASLKELSEVQKSIYKHLTNKELTLSPEKMKDILEKHVNPEQKELVQRLDKTLEAKDATITSIDEALSLFMKRPESKERWDLIRKQTEYLKELRDSDIRETREKEKYTDRNFMKSFGQEMMNDVPALRGIAGLLGKLTGSGGPISYEAYNRNFNYEMGEIGNRGTERREKSAHDLQLKGIMGQGVLDSYNIAERSKSLFENSRTRHLLTGLTGNNDFLNRENKDDRAPSIPTEADVQKGGAYGMMSGFLLLNRRLKAIQEGKSTLPGEVPSVANSSGMGMGMRAMGGMSIVTNLLDTLMTGDVGGLVAGGDSAGGLENAIGNAIKWGSMGMTFGIKGLIVGAIAGFVTGLIGLDKLKAFADDKSIGGQAIEKAKRGETLTDEERKEMQKKGEAAGSHTGGVISGRNNYDTGGHVTGGNIGDEVSSKLQVGEFVTPIGGFNKLETLMVQLIDSQNKTTEAMRENIAVLKEKKLTVEASSSDSGYTNSINKNFAMST